MALVKMKDLLLRAQKENKGCGAFSVGNMEMVKGAIKAAEELDTPIILQIAEVRLEHSPLHLMGPMMLEAARNAKVDVAVHLDHGLKFETIKKALEYGFTSVMLDASRDSFEENIEKTKKVVELAAKYGATVEAELGLVGGSEDGKSDHGIRCTNPEDAKIFCEKTGIDAIWEIISEYFELVKSNHYFEEKRQNQNQFWMMETINEQLKSHFYNHPNIMQLLEENKKAVQNNEISPFAAAVNLLEQYFINKE